MQEERLLENAVGYLNSSAYMVEGRNLQMPGDGRYQPEKLKAFLGYDQWAGWLIIVEWFWLMALAKIGEIPKSIAELLTKDMLLRLLQQITTTKQDKKESITKHDILALLELMKAELPEELHRYLHFGLTSYDVIDTAYALQLRETFMGVFWPEMCLLDRIWRKKIEESCEVIQAGRTHLQTALPVTIGFWLSVLHGRFIDCSRLLYRLAEKVPGKLTGAVGTSASLVVLLGREESEKAKNVFSELLGGLSLAKITTQIVPPEPMARFYYESVLLSGAFANLGEDVRILQSSQFGELTSPSSSSSTMSHKKANPIAAENVCGMHTTVIAEFSKIILNLVSDLQRDLRGSSVKRSYSAVMVYVFQQILTMGKILNNLTINEKRCQENFKQSSHLVVAELLHLSLQRAGFLDSHKFVNKIIVPLAEEKNLNLGAVLDDYLEDNSHSKLKEIWLNFPDDIRDIFRCPENYLGNAIEIAEAEIENKLEKIV